MCCAPLETADITARGSDRIAAGSANAWPSQRQLLLLKLWATIFQASDRRHPVITPASLLMGACLALSPVPSREAVLAGQFSAQLYIASDGDVLAAILDSVDESFL